MKKKRDYISISAGAGCLPSTLNSMNGTKPISLEVVQGHVVMYVYFYLVYTDLSFHDRAEKSNFNNMRWTSKRRLDVYLKAQKLKM